MDSPVDEWRAAIARHQTMVARFDRLEPDLQRVFQLSAGALKNGRKLLFFGNGGSAADSQHLAAELVVRFRKVRQALPALALTANTSVLTAHSNDFSFDSVFARQVEALCRKGDVVFGLSTSGKSPSVVQGIEAARGRGAHTVAMTGEAESPLSAIAEVTLRVPCDETARVQEGHMLIGHWLCDMLESHLAHQKA